jgi:thioredoxin reductase
VGLAAAAHLIERGESFVVLEAGSRVGHSVLQWGHVRVFSPWRYNLDQAAVRLLESGGWSRPKAEVLPTGREIVEQYLEPLAGALRRKGEIRLNARVVAVGRRDFDKVKSAGRDTQPFTVRIVLGDHEEEMLARAVIDASGTWGSPNPLGSGGYPIMGEGAAADGVSYGIPDVLGADRRLYAGKTTLVVGSGHSAINTLLDLAKLAEGEAGTRIIWAVRRADEDSLFGGGAADALAARGALGTSARRAVSSGRIELLTSFRARTIRRRKDSGLNVTGTREGRETELATDRVVVATGFRPDFSFLKEVRLSVDPWLEAASALAPLIDPNVHSCGTVRPHGAAELAHPERDFYIAGMKSYGRAPTFLLATGYEQVRSIVAKLVGDDEAAARVELDLPETGVCSSNLGQSVAEGCCGGPAPETVDACCATDAKAKAAGGKGCRTTTVAVPVAVGAKSGSCCGPSKS